MTNPELDAIVDEVVRRLHSEIDELARKHGTVASEREDVDAIHKLLLKAEEVLRARSW